MSSPDPLAFARGLLESLLPDTDAEGWPVRADHLEAGDEPVLNGAGLLLLQEAGGIRDRQLPVWKFRISVKSYGLDGEQAAKGLRVVSDLLHGRGPVTTALGRMFKAFDETGPQPTVDPPTQWQVLFGVFEFVVPDR